MLEQQMEAPARSSGLKQLAQERRAPDAREIMPAIAGEHAGVDQRDGNELVRMRCGPREPPRPSEVVQHQMRPADVELGQGTGEMLGIPADGVLETWGFVGAPEARHVERHDAPELRRRRGEARPIARRAGIPVDEYDGLVRFRTTTFQQRRAHAVDPYLAGAQNVVRHAPANMPFAGMAATRRGEPHLAGSGCGHIFDRSQMP